MKHPVIQKYNYHIWANNQVFEHLKSLPDEVYNREVESVFPSVSEVLFHIYQVDGLYMSVLSGDTFEQTMQVIRELEEKAKNKEMPVVQALYQQLADDYLAFFDQQDLADVKTVTHPRYGSLTVPLAEIIAHVVNHGSYHRGNITAMLRQQGHAGVPTDYLLYLYAIQ